MRKQTEEQDDAQREAEKAIFEKAAGIYEQNVRKNFDVGAQFTTPSPFRTPSLRHYLDALVKYLKAIGRQDVDSWTHESWTGELANAFRCGYEHARVPQYTDEATMMKYASKKDLEDYRAAKSIKRMKTRVGAFTEEERRTFESSQQPMEGWRS